MARKPKPRTCRTCKKTRSHDDFRSSQAKRCEHCRTAPPAPKPPRPCNRCGVEFPASEFVHKGRVCVSCREAGFPCDNRPCLRCFVVKPAGEFPMGDGSKAVVGRPTRRRICHECIRVEQEERERRASERRATWVDSETGNHVRRCRHCGETKDLETGFYNEKSEAAEPRIQRRKSYRCKACQIARISEKMRERASNPETREEQLRWWREYRRRWRAENPEREAESHRRWYERTMADPEKRQRYLESKRMDYRLRREQLDGVHLDEIRAIPRARNRDEPVFVPSAQLAVAIEEAARAAGGVRTGNNLDGLVETICGQCDVSERAVYAWRTGERPHIGIDVADRVLTALDLLWWDVWNESTARRPLILARTYTRRMKRGRRGVKRTVIERGERHYGDAGPDMDTLRAVEQAWEGDREEATAA